MNIKWTLLPIYSIEITYIYNDWELHNKRYVLGLTEKDMKAVALTVLDDDDSVGKIYVLLREGYLDYNTISHELLHILTYVCKLRDIKLDADNDEPLAYLQGHIASELFSFRDICLMQPQTSP